ncbi:MAG: hypothetical protein DRQ99_23860, partial [Candidatus Parabeggiatoa sp. nov. 3]
KVSIPLENQGNHKGLPLQSARRGNPLWLPLLMLAKWSQDCSDPALGGEQPEKYRFKKELQWLGVFLKKGSSGPIIMKNLFCEGLECKIYFAKAWSAKFILRRPRLIMTLFLRMNAPQWLVFCTKRKELKCQPPFHDRILNYFSKKSCNGLRKSISLCNNLLHDYCFSISYFLKQRNLVQRITWRIVGR